MILFCEHTGAGSDDRLMKSQYQASIVLHGSVEHSQHPVLQFIVEVDNYIPANYYIEIYLK